MGPYQYCLNSLPTNAVACAVDFCIKAMQQLNDALLPKQCITNVLMLLCVQHETTPTPQGNHSSSQRCYKAMANALRGRDLQLTASWTLQGD